MTPVSDGGLPYCSVGANLTLPGETESGSAGMQPDKENQVDGAPRVHQAPDGKSHRGPFP
jgi:hypothetical protein